MQHRKNITHGHVMVGHFGIKIRCLGGVSLGPRSYAEKLKYVLRGVFWGKGGNGAVEEERL